MTGKDSVMTRITINSALAGDHESARCVLETFCDSVERGLAPGPMILKYVASAFRRVIIGEKADVALGLTQAGRGRPKKLQGFPKTDEDHREVSYAMEIIQYVDSGHKYSEAYRLVAKNNHVSVMKVRRAWKKWRMPCEELHSLGKKLQGHKLAELKLIHRIRQEGLAKFYEIGVAAASENPDKTPVSSWNVQKGMPDIARLVKSYTEPLEGLEGDLLTEAEVRASFLRGFRNAHKRIRRAADSREGLA